MSILTSTPLELQTEIFKKRMPSTNIFTRTKSIFSFLTKKSSLIVIIALLVLTGVYFIFSNTKTVDSSKVLSLSSQKFDVVAKTQDGKNTNGKINVEVISAQKAGQMLVQGQTVVAKNAKTFLIINMELTNSYSLPLYTYPVDSFRLIGSDGKRFSPVAHQGNVEIRPESTKTSNVGFVVPTTQKKFKVEIGDINAANKSVLEFSL